MNVGRSPFGVWRSAFDCGRFTPNAERQTVNSKLSSRSPVPGPHDRSAVVQPLRHIENYEPRTLRLNPFPGPGLSPIQVRSIASANAFPAITPFVFPFTSIVVPVPGT